MDFFIHTQDVLRLKQLFLTSRGKRDESNYNCSKLRERRQKGKAKLFYKWVRIDVTCRGM